MSPSRPHGRAAATYRRWNWSTRRSRALEARRDLNVLVHEQFEAARAAAADPHLGGPLAGVPFLLKDLGEPQAGMPEYMGSRALRDHVAAETAWTVQRYQTAGLIICGRTNTAEFGNHCATEPALFGRTLNPWAPERSPGGSSGGSAAAVAAGLSARRRAATAPARSGCLRPAVAWSASSRVAGRSSFAPSGGAALDGLANKHALTRTRARLRAAARRHRRQRAGRSLRGAAAGPARSSRRSGPIRADPARAVRWSARRSPARPSRPSRPSPITRRATLEGLGHHIESGALSFDAEVMRRSISVIHAVDNAATFTWLER